VVRPWATVWPMPLQCPWRVTWQKRISAQDLPFVAASVDHSMAFVYCVMGEAGLGTTRLECYGRTRSFATASFIASCKTFLRICSALLRMRPLAFSLSSSVMRSSRSLLISGSYFSLSGQFTCGVGRVHGPPAFRCLSHRAVRPLTILNWKNGTTLKSRLSTDEISR
jgi:hypothetical protein